MIKPPEVTRTLDHALVMRMTKIIDASKAPILIADWMKEDGITTAPTLFGRYHPRMLLMLVLATAYLSDPYTLGRFLNLIWCGMTRESHAELDILDLVTESRREQLTSADRWDGEYQRLWLGWKQMVSVFDFSPYRDLPARKYLNSELEVYRSLRTPEEIARDEVLYDRAHRLFNALLRATMSSRPSYYRGDVALDEHQVRARYNPIGTGTRADLFHCFDPDAYYVPHHPKGRGWFYGVTTSKRMHRTYGKQVGHCVTGIVVGRPTGGSAAAALEVLDWHIANGQGPLTNRPAHFILDMGFSQKDGIDLPALLKGYVVFRQFPAPSRGVRRPVELAEGPWIYQGRILCPAARKLVQLKLELPTPKASLTEKLNHRRLEKLLLAHQMPTNGKPRLLKQWRGGRPRKDEPETNPPIAVRVICPCRAGQLRCSVLLEESKKMDRRIPRAHDAPRRDEEPLVCQTGYSHVLLEEKQLKLLSVEMEGTYRHNDGYGGRRARDEQEHSYFVNFKTGAAVVQHSFEVTGIASLGLIATCGFGANNLNNQRSWLAWIRRNRGVIPVDPRVEQRAERRRFFAKHKLGPYSSQ